LNTYGYVEGNPLKYIDPTGENTALIRLMEPIGLGLVATAACATHPELSEQIIEQVVGDIKDLFTQYNLPLDKGGEEWGRRNGVGAAEGRRRAHNAKKRDRMSGARDKYTVDPASGNVYDPEGEYVGNLNDDYD